MTEKELHKFVTDKKNIKNATALAIQFQSINKNWVSVDQLVKKLKDSTESIKNKLNVLVIMKMCVTDIIDGQQKYKIMLDTAQRKRFYESKIAELEADIVDLKEEIKNLS